MVAVEGGDLYVGNSSTPLSESINVTISDFSIGKTEVTQGLWFAVMASFSGEVPTDNYGSGTNYPMYGVSWDDVASNCTVAIRTGYLPDLRDCDYGLGFRLVLVPLI